MGTPLTAPGKADFMTDKAYPTLDLGIFGASPSFYDFSTICTRFTTVKAPPTFLDPRAWQQVESDSVGKPDAWLVKATTNHEVNGAPAGIARFSATLIGVFVPEIVDGRFTDIRIIVDPDEIRFAGRQLDGLSHSGGLSGS